ncbi:hypothetical protein [Caballeronia sp. INML3]|uniref:hypothetical protein n=2 Tax=unclassified Caballeronia TaxID=2646786 RepID=UPI0020326D25|nr:hypothetical protein [Caballeronia sp. INML3]
MSEAETQYLSAQVVQLAAGEAGPDAWLSPLDANQRWRLAGFVGALETYGLRGKPLKKASSSSVEVERRVMTAGASLLMEGVAAGHRLLAAIRAPTHADGNLQLLSQAFPQLLVMARKQLSPVERQWIFDLVASYAHQTIDSDTPVIWERKFDRKTPSPSKRMAKTKARSRRMIAMLSRAGITPRVRTTRSGRTKVIVGESQLIGLKGLRDDSLSFKATVRQYGLSTNRLRSLAEAGLLALDHGRVRRSSIDLLLKGTGKHAIPCPDGAEIDLISVAEALRYRVPVSRTTEFFDAVCEGRLPVFTRMNGDVVHFKTLHLNSSALQAFMGNVEAEEGEALSIPEAAKALRLKQEVMYHLVKVGLVRTVVARLGRRSAKVIQQSEILRFTEEVEPLVQAASRAGVGTREAVRWARANGIDLISGPSIDNGRQYFVMCVPPDCEPARRGRGKLMKVDHPAASELRGED